MFDLLMQSIIVSFSLGAIVGVALAPHLIRLDGPSRGLKGDHGDSALVKVRVRRD